MSLKPKDFSSLLELQAAMPDEKAATAHFTAIRWKHGEFCPYCGTDKIYHFGDGKTHKCAACRQRFSIKVGTIFEDSKLPLRTWMMAVWFVSSHKKSIASTQLAKDLGVTQKTAWFMMHRLRYAARTRSFNRPLTGTVEVDETFVGGREANKHATKRNAPKDWRKGKTVVVGMLERGGELRAHVEPDMKKIPGKVILNVEVGSNLMTDEWGGYRVMGAFFKHHTVNHASGEYAKGASPLIRPMVRRARFSAPVGLANGPAFLPPSKGHPASSDAGLRSATPGPIPVVYSRFGQGEPCLVRGSRTQSWLFSIAG